MISCAYILWNCTGEWQHLEWWGKFILITKSWVMSVVSDNEMEGKDNITKWHKPQTREQRGNDVKPALEMRVVRCESYGRRWVGFWGSLRKKPGFSTASNRSHRSLNLRLYTNLLQNVLLWPGPLLWPSGVLLSTLKTQLTTLFSGKPSLLHLSHYILFNFTLKILNTLRGENVSLTLHAVIQHI